jgi:hypothetical protein
MQVDDIATPHQSAQRQDCANISKMWFATIVKKSHMVGAQVGGRDGEGCISFGRARHNRPMARRDCRLD